MTQEKISDMISQSRDIFSKRDIATFETHENKGGLRDAIIYVAIAGAITGLFLCIPMFIFPLSSADLSLDANAGNKWQMPFILWRYLTFGVSSSVIGILTTLLGFFVFTYLVFFIGKQFGGTGTFDQVAYTFSLFYAPLWILFSLIIIIVAFFTMGGILLVPFVGLVAIIANIYFAYRAMRSSMNMHDSGKIWLTLILAMLGFIIAIRCVSWLILILAGLGLWVHSWLFYLTGRMVH